MSPSVSQSHPFLERNPCHPSPCANNGVCTDVNGGFTCRCRAGYKGDRCHGKFPGIQQKILRNVVSESSFFQNDENHDIENVFCYRFFSPIEIDKCSPSPCQHGGVCSEVIGGLGYACRCAYGYKGQDCERKEMNEHIVARK